MTALAIVLARAGSKGVPGKNAASVAGRPCAAWTIDHARASSRVGLVIVSTDDPRVAQLATGPGVRAHPRPPALASDSATIDDAARDAVRWGDAHAGSGALDPVVLLYANVPVRPAGLIDRAVDLLESSGADSVQSYAPVGKHHPWWTARLDEHGRVRPWEGEVLNHGVYRRQDLPPAFVPDGGVLVVRRRALFLELPGVAPGPHAFLGAERRGVRTGEGQVVDIDAPVDLLVADALLRPHPPGEPAR